MNANTSRDHDSLAHYRITIDSAFEGGDPIRLKVALSDIRSHYGDKEPTCQMVAQQYAADYCDSGSVTVTRGTERGMVARRQIS